MKIDNAVVSITGANRGIGAAFATELLALGARKVHVGARHPASVQRADVHAVKLDVTQPDDIAGAASRCGDLTLLINEAGIAVPGAFPTADSALPAQQTQVLALHVGFVDTDLTRSIGALKSSPQLIVRRALDALEAGASEVMADEVTQQVKRHLSSEPAASMPQTA